MGSLVEDYAAGSPALVSAYGGTPTSLFDQPPAARPWDPGLLDALRRYQARLGLDREFSGNEAVVITGQQPGLFGGPLYSVYKAITALKAAERVTARTGVPCVPIFWVGSEDHDFEEGRDAHFYTKRHTRLSLRYAPKADVRGLPMYRVPAEASLHTMVDEAYDAVGRDDTGVSVRAFLHDALDAASSLSDWSARVLARLFRDTPLVFFTPELPEARTAARDILTAAIDDPLETTRRVNAGGDSLAAQGYSVQVEKNADECAFFVEVDGRRRKVTYADGEFLLPEERTRFSASDLKAILNDEPTRFSPNVALRCIVQQALFPTAAYVAGPGEIAYWGQLKDVFAQYDQPMPIVYPRAQATLISTKERQLLNRHGFELADIARPEHELVDLVLRQQPPNPAIDILAEERAVIEAALDRLATRMEQLDRHYQPAVDATSKFAARSRFRLDRVERAVYHNDKQEAAAARAQVARLQTALWPGRAPQERVYTAYTYVFEHGWDLIPKLINSLDITATGLQLVER